MNNKKSVVVSQDSKVSSEDVPRLGVVADAIIEARETYLKFYDRFSLSLAGIKSFQSSAVSFHNNTFDVINKMNTQTVKLVDFVQNFNTRFDLSPFLEMAQKSKSTPLIFPEIIPKVSYIPQARNLTLETQIKQLRVAEELLEHVRKGEKLKYDIVPAHPNKRQMSSEISRLKKTCSLSKMETLLFMELRDFQPHTTKSLTGAVGSKAITVLKKSLRDKIVKEGYEIRSKRGGSFHDSFYCLEILTV